MEETTDFKVEITMRSGRVVEVVATELELGWLYDKMFGRESGNFQNLGDKVVCIGDIESLKIEEVL